MSVITLIGVIAFPFWHKHQQKKERQELLKLWAEWDFKHDHEELIETIREIQKETIEELFQVEQHAKI